MSSFQERQKNLFDHLKRAENQHKAPGTDAVTNAEYGTIDRLTYRRLKGEMKRFRGKESIFKRPEATLRECLRARTIPDHIKNPQKWMYYSLADVTPDQMSDATNTATALACLKEMEDRETSKTEMDTDGVFKKPTFKISKTIKNELDSDPKITYKNNKIIMPEYVVGVSDKKKKSTKKEDKTNPDQVGKVELKLDHLYDE